MFQKNIARAVLLMFTSLMLTLFFQNCGQNQLAFQSAFNSNDIEVSSEKADHDPMIADEENSELIKDIKTPSNLTLGKTYRLVSYEYQGQVYKLEQFHPTLTLHRIGNSDKSKFSFSHACKDQSLSGTVRMTRRNDLPLKFGAIAFQVESNQVPTAEDMSYNTVQVVKKSILPAIECVNTKVNMLVYSTIERSLELAIKYVIAGQQLIIFTRTGDTLIFEVDRSTVAQLDISGLYIATKWTGNLCPEKNIDRETLCTMEYIEKSLSNNHFIRFDKNSKLSAYGFCRSASANYTTRSASDSTGKISITNFQVVFRDPERNLEQSGANCSSASIQQTEDMFVFLKNASTLVVDKENNIIVIKTQIGNLLYLKKVPNEVVY